MEPKHLVQLAAVLDCGSINLAAQQLNITQPTLTKNMQTLEMQVGASLFSRSRHGVRQTELGEALAREGRVIADAVRNVQQIAVRHGLGMESEIRMSVGPLVAALLMHRVTASLKAQMPELSLMIQVGTPWTAIDQLNRGQLDVVIGPAVPTARPEIERIRLFEDEVAVFASASHPLAQADKLDASDLDGYDWINLATYAFLDESPVEPLLRAGIQRFNTAIALSGDVMICFNSMTMGHYLSLMPVRLTRQAQQDYGLKRLPIDADFGYRHLYLWHRRDGKFQGLVENIRDTVMQVLQEE
ncbi:LysR family transcriptional regulator [Marinobacterium sp. YM272]|uniref:LysR family transcriptional regulator n=1 Tax=Marinobacterium sp. YM272 TaxID=3421654 RepID=UPI003D7F47C8